MNRTPCIVITRDRVSYTRLCVASLEPFCDQLEIRLVDHGSTWPPMLDYLDESPYLVHRRGNLPPRALWDWPGLGDLVGDRPYLVTDPDVVLDADCPDDWLNQLTRELNLGDVVKAGLGLRIDDLPATSMAADVCRWETAFWHERTPTGVAFRAPVDTTLALYQPLPRYPTFTLHPGARLDAPYLARHLPWYGDLDAAEAAHYRKRALPGASHWTNGGW